MFASERLLARLARIRKDSRTASSEELEEPIRSAFTSLLGSLPPGMPAAVFDQFWALVIRRGDDQTPVVDKAKYLADVVDLFCGQYDSENDPLAPEDWPAVRELVNDFAIDMDMATVTEIMTQVVDHGGQ